MRGGTRLALQTHQSSTSVTVSWLSRAIFHACSADHLDASPKVGGLSEVSATLVTASHRQKAFHTCSVFLSIPRMHLNAVHSVILIPSQSDPRNKTTLLPFNSGFVIEGAQHTFDTQTQIRGEGTAECLTPSHTHTLTHCQLDGPDSSTNDTAIFRQPSSVTAEAGGTHTLSL